MFKKLVDTVKQYGKKILGIGGAVAATTATKSEAVITGVPADIWAAVDTTGLATNVATVLVSMIGITLLFVAYRFAKTSLRR